MIFRPFLLALVLLSGHAQARTFLGVVSQITDGDTLWVKPDGRGRPRKLRIDGIDAPEICQTGGEASRNMLTQRALNRRVEVTVNRRDMYGRGLAIIRVDGNDLGAQMVRSGQAWSYRWHRSIGPYATEEAAARQSRLGLFTSGEPEGPHDFRKRHGSCHAGR